MSGDDLDDEDDESEEERAERLAAYESWQVNRAIDRAVDEACADGLLTYIDGNLAKVR